jgi:hypothetical protein
MNTPRYENLPESDNTGYFTPCEITDCVGLTETCFFYEDKGKDLNEFYGRRWRVCFYYESHKAITRFFSSEESKNKFILKLKGGG